MAKYEYSTVLGKLEEFLKKIRDKEIGVPEKATVKWLESLGYKSKNDRSILKVLKAIGFADDKGVPTELWKQYRGSNPKQVMAHAIHSGYGDLFDVYPNACEISDDKLEAFFASHTTAGGQVINKTVGTFKVLCSLADSSAIGEVTKDEVPAKVKDKVESAKNAVSAQQKKGMGEIGSGVTVNINIQLALPESMDADGYAEFFAALKEHLLTEENGSN